MADEEDEGRWIWVSFATEHRLILAHVVGPRNHASAETLIQRTDKRITGELPLFVSDGLDLYSIALTEQYHVTVTFPKTGKRGRPRKPKKVPRPDLRYAQVVKYRERGRVVAVTKRVVFGNEENIPEEKISTSHIERQNLNFRHENKRLSRKTPAFSKKDEPLDDHIKVYIAYHTFCRPHRALEVPQKERVTGRVFRLKRKRTPAMSAGFTDHIWSLRELLSTKWYLISTD